ncbi:ATP-binding protein [Nocardioides sp.]|uniref:PAS domain-containing sensor histidine kinase n=1 Tax=Nocardioides sp. TaxID=35761 RepID=UPI00286A928D|nr:ATP-binding protein [Nocardioides sp.]
MHTPTPSQRPHVGEVGLVLLAMALTFVVSAVVDLAEVRARWLLRHEAYNIDELIVTGLVGMVGFALVAWRRSRLLRVELERSARIDRALRETTERYRSLFDYHPSAVFSLDLEGRFTSVNTAAEQISGYAASELEGMSFAELLPAEELERTLSTFALLVSREPQRFEVGFHHKSGATVDLRITGLPIIVGDEVVGVYGIAEDVTEHNLMQAALAEARRAAEEASDAKSLFLATMSHEIRTPLTSVLAAVEVLAANDLDPGQRHLTEIMDRQGRALLRLVEEILDFSRIEAGVIELESVDLDLTSLVGEAVAHHSPAAEAKGLRLHATVDQALPRDLSGDATRLGQVLSNLVGNAVKFTDAGWVRVQVTQDPSPHRPVVRFTVADSGIGVTAEQQDGLFDSFQQADSSITRRFGGTGLGLAICRQLVTAMGGTIGLESSPGAGSTFTVTVPLDRRTTAAATSA